MSNARIRRLLRGEMLTRPLVFEGSELVMNYSTSAAVSRSRSRLPSR